jgi:long-chain acyl-CoA synthetase
MTMGILRWQSPDNPALILEDGQVITYSQLKVEVLKLKEHLPSNQLVFLVGSNVMSTIVAYLACLEAGAVPLLLGKELSKTMLEQLLRTYSPRYIFLPTDAKYDTSQFVVKSNCGSHSFYENIAGQSTQCHPDLAVLLPTSGTTGSPKLVRLSLENLRSNAQAIVQYLGISSDERAITSLPFNYSYGLSVINTHLVVGASLVLTDASLIDASFWQLINSAKVTSLAGVPYSYDILLKLRLGQMSTPTLRTFTQAGGGLDPVKAAQLWDICQTKGARFFPMYGQTEATARMAYLESSEVKRKLGSIGKAIPGGNLWIEDETGQTISTARITGELIYSGPNVCLGYAECRADLSVGDSNGGVLRTGDLAEKDEEGYFYIKGRKHRFLKIFGKRVSLEAVEKWFVDRELTCAAHGTDDQLMVSVEGEQCLIAELLSSEAAAAFNLHPAAVKVRIVAKIPRLNTGKIDYLCLNQIC